MNRFEQEFYYNVEKGVKALEKIAKELQKLNEKPEMPLNEDGILDSDDLGTYDDSGVYGKQTLKDMIADIANPNKNQEKANPFDDIINDVTERTGKLQKINESLDSFFSIRKPLYSRSMNLTKLQKKSWADDGLANWSHGEMTQYMLHFVKENPGCTYTDMNKFYLCFIGNVTSYNPVEHRGGSFPHHYQSLVSKKTRRCTQDVKNHFELNNVGEQWIEKYDGGYYYNEC